MELRDGEFSEAHHLNTNIPSVRFCPFCSQLSSQCLVALDTNLLNE